MNKETEKDEILFKTKNLADISFFDKVNKIYNHLQIGQLSHTEVDKKLSELLET